MNTRRWGRAKEIFDAALDLQSDARASYLLQVCGDDLELQHEVEGLLAADADAGSFMNPGWLTPFSPFAPEPEFQLTPGDVVSGRFKIVRPLGDGGMGCVYEAHDSVLGVQVALKTLRPEISANSEVLFRFRQEVRIAHRITHPNVCRTYHLDHELRKIGDDESSSVDLTFLTMEFLEGETLQQLLKRCGRISLERALVIARQMAEAIEAAHQIGVIHRDIKPGNVMICPSTSGEERVVITDFGLAKFETGAAHNDHSSISQPGRAMGTLSYMSPEQLKGEEVGPGTDTYAFGLILYEMVTGAKAFPDSSTMATAYRRSFEPPPSPRAITSDLPAAWEMAILGCLQIDPAARFHTATEVTEILDGSMPYASRLRSLQRARTKHNMLSRRNAVAIGFAVVVAVSFFAVGSRYFFTREGSTVATGTLIYLAPVKNETGEKQLDNVTELVRAGLEQSAHINLLDSGRVGDILEQMTQSSNATISDPTAREIAMRANAARIVLPTIRRAGDELSLDVDIQKPDNTPLRFREHWLHSWTWHSTHIERSSGAIPPALLSTVRDASDWVRRTVGESASDMGQLDAPPEDVTTSNWEALTFFAQAERLDAQHLQWQAVLALRNAIKIDPKFSIAYARLGDILFAINRDAEGLAAYKSALVSSTERSLSRKELDRVQGMYASDTFDYETAVQSFRDYAAFYPNDFIGWAYPTSALRALQRNEEDIANLRRAVALEPHRSMVTLSLASELVITGHTDEAHHWLIQMRNDGFQSYALEEEGTIHFLAFDFPAAEQDFRKMEVAGQLSRRARGYRLLLRLYAEQGQYAEALRIAEDGMKEDLAQGDLPAKSMGLLDRATLRCHLAQYDGCLEDIRQGLVLDEAPRTLLLSEDILGAAFITAPTQQAAQIRHEIHFIEGRVLARDDGFISRVLRLRARGESLLADQRIPEALAQMQRASALDAPAKDREYLGRALVAAAKSSKQNARQYLKEALKAYGVSVLAPPAAWDEPLESQPGFLADEAGEYVDVSLKLGILDADTVRARLLLSSLRPHILASFPRLQKVQNLASQVSGEQPTTQH